VWSAGGDVWPALGWSAHRGLRKPWRPPVPSTPLVERSEEHTSELQSLTNIVCRLLLEKKKQKKAKGHRDVDDIPRSDTHHRVAVCHLSSPRVKSSPNIRLTYASSRVSKARQTSVDAIA